MDKDYFPAVQTHAIASRHVAQTFKIQVMRPAHRAGEHTRFPVVYATDGNFAFDALKGISWSLQHSGRDAPRFILVGIGYPGESPFAGVALRGRDLTFPLYPQLASKPSRTEGVLRAAPGTTEFYGAADFQRFIEQELIPLIDGNYRTIPGERAYFGHSAGGGFGLFTLFNRPDLFKRYIVSSPGLSYHGESSAGVRYDNYEFLMQQAQKFIASKQSLEGVSLYMSVGSEEEFEPDVRQWRFTSSFYRMAALLKTSTLPGLELTTEVFAGETHMAVWPMAFIHGIRAVFGTRICG